MSTQAWTGHRSKVIRSHAGAGFESTSEVRSRKWMRLYKPGRSDTFSRVVAITLSRNLLLPRFLLGEFGEQLAVRRCDHAGNHS